MTSGWGRTSFVNQWQNLAQHKWGNKAPESINAGHNGETAQDGYYRVDREVIDAKPEIVTIMFGHNSADPVRDITPVLLETTFVKA